jgi:hypothetical protein
VLVLGLVPAGALHHARGLSSPGAGLAWVAGVVGLLSVVGLAAYAVPKRLGPKRGRLRPSADGDAPRAAVRVASHYRIHLALGLASLVAVALHSGLRLGAGVAGALGLAFWLTAGLGLAAAAAYRWLPHRLTLLERAGALPEDLKGERERLFDRLHRATTGTSELTKVVMEKLLLPYARAPLGPLWLLGSGRSLGEERRAVRARVDAVLKGQGGDRLDGLDELIGVVVELRALPARRLLNACLRGSVIAHVVGTGMVLCLGVLHVLQMVRW